MLSQDIIGSLLELLQLVRILSCTSTNPRLISRYCVGLIDMNPICYIIVLLILHF